MADTKTLPEFKKFIPWKLAVVFIFFAVTIIFAGYYYYSSQKKTIFTEQQNNLSAIATLKISRIAQWHKERIGNAAVIKINEPLINTIKEYIDNESTPDLKSEIIKWMEAVCIEYEYSEVIIFDTHKKIRIAFGQSDSISAEAVSDEIDDVITYKKIVMTDLHMGKKKAYMDLLVPLINRTNKRDTIFGVLILRIDPGKSLFPIVQSWPVTSKTAETLLLRKEGDSVLYLNELRFRKNTALKLSRPISQKDLLASKAISGYSGIAEGVDYRNIPVIGYIAAIPGFPWYMVAKIDKDEIQVPLKRLFNITGTVIVLLILICASLFWFLTRQKLINVYRKQLEYERAIRESDERFTTAFRLSPVSISISSLIDNKFIDVNQTFLTDMEYNREEVIGRTAKELDIWHDENERLWLINEIDQKNNIYGKIIRFKSKSGKIIYGLCSMSVVNVDGQPSNLSTVVNITESIQTEEKFRKSEELFRKLFENMLNGFAYCKIVCEEGYPTDFLYIKVNEAFVKLTGLKDVEGKKASVAIPGIQEADPELLERYKRVALTGEPEVFETYVESMEMWFAISVYSPQKEYFVAVFDVITARKLSEAALRESEDKFKYIFDHSVIGKSITFPSGEMHVNKAFCDMMGYSAEEMATKKWQEMTHADDLERTQREADLLLSHEKVSSRFLKRYIKKDGDVLWTDVSTVLRCDQENNPLYFMTTINDITERKKVEDALRKAETQLINYNKDLEKSVALRTEQLEAANKELEAFSYSVSHDLRAPLRSLNGFTKILQEDYETILDKEGNRICGIISSSATQMGELIDDLLSFSRIGRSSLTSSEIDMKKMAHVIFEGITSPAERERIKLTFGKMQSAVGDVTLFGHVWTNLISNAIKYSSKKDVSKINIGSYADEKMVVFFIRDNGVGFDMKYSHKLFGVFQRLHTEAEFEGNGVGLAIIQRIIAKHGGKVWAEGEIGKGATFYFSLPVQD